MANVPEGFDPASVRATGREKKCGTCKNFTVRPPEVELAKYALPIGACGPGIHCLGGAVRGMCQALGQMVESTDMVPRVACGGKFYVPGGPSVRGVEQVASVMGRRGPHMQGSANTGPKPSLAEQVSGGGYDGSWLPFVAISAVVLGKEVKKRFFGG